MSKPQLLLYHIHNNTNSLFFSLSIFSPPSLYNPNNRIGLISRLVFHALLFSYPNPSPFSPRSVNKVMVSIRRRKLLALNSGQTSLLDPLSRAFEHGLTPDNWGDSKKPVDFHRQPLKEETTSGTAQGSPDLDASSTPSKEHLVQKFPEVRRRKRHRRKHVENQEACTMRGVYYKNRKWQAAIKVDKKQIHLGTVSSEEEAARLYDRAAFMCGREPNFALSEEEKQELRQYNWDEFLAITRSAITNKRQRRSGADSRRKLPNEDWEGQSSFSASEDDVLAS